MNDRKTFTSSTCKAGCMVCYGLEAKWFGPNAMAVAARHHDATGHQTWAERYISVTYGEKDDSHQQQLFPQD